MSYFRPHQALGSNQSAPSKFSRVPRALGSSIELDYDLRTRVHGGLGSNQSAPSKYARIARALGMGSITEYGSGTAASIATHLPPPPPPPPPQGRRVLSVPRGATRSYGFGSLGDDTDQAPATTLAQPTLAAPTIVDPAPAAADVWSDWRVQMLNQTTAIAAAQQDFTQRESLQRWFQIGATLAIPLSAAIWRAIFRGSRSSTKDFE